LADEEATVPAEVPAATPASTTTPTTAPVYTQLTQVRVPLDEAAEALALPDAQGRVPIVILPTRPNRVRVEALAAAGVAVLTTFVFEFSFVFESLLIVLAVALVVVAVFRSFLVPVPEGARALLLRRGRYDRTLGPGIHVAPPWIAVGHLVTTREIPFDAPAIEVPTKDGVRVAVDVLATFAISQPERFVYAIAASDFDQVCLAACVTATRDAVRAAKVDEVIGFSEPDADRLSSALGEMLDGYGVEIKRAAFTSIRPPNDYMASMEGIRLATIQQPEQEARHALELRRQADRDDLKRQAAAAKKALVEEEAAVEELRLRRLHERIAAFPDAARWDVDSARLEIARSLAANTRAMVQLGPGTDVANALLGREIVDEAPPVATAKPPARRGRTPQKG
jgi:regulator of protease activity HflC (stomatin/prohibitin superfamily)